MSLADVPGSFLVPITPGYNPLLTGPGMFTDAVVLDAANEACVFVGRVVTSDGASHTIDTTGSSALHWRSGSVTFANAATTVKVGLAAVDGAVGPAPRAANAANVISFDVSKSMVGGGGGVAASTFASHVPDAGTKTIANGDLVAFAIQMTARGGVDSVGVNTQQCSAPMHHNSFTLFTGGTYAAASGNSPMCLITFSDGALGWFFAGEVFTSINTRTWNSGSATKEYGQLYQLPFPVKVFGLCGFIDPDADCDVILYSDPLGTPVAERTISFDANTMLVASPRRFITPFSSPFTAAANQPLGAVFKPGGSSVSVSYKTLASATHRIVDPFGTAGYGISRASGAFANANSSLDHYYIGLVVSAFGPDAIVSGLHPIDRGIA